MEDIRTYLESKYAVIKGETADELRVVCFFCNEDSSKRGRLYINKTYPHPLWCHLCEKSGAINTIRKHYGDEPILDEDYQKSHNRTPEEIVTTDQWRIFQTASAFYYDSLADNEEAFRYLRYDRGLDFETIEKFRLGWANGRLHEHLLEKGFEVGDIVRSGLVQERGGNLHDFLIHKLAIPYVRNGSVVSIRGKDMKGKYLTLPGAKAMPFGSDNVIGKESVILCEGEIDMMTLWQMGFDAMGVPGATSYNVSWNDYIEEAKRVFVMFDPDDAGRAGAEKTAIKIGNRAKVVSLPEVSSKNDINDLVVEHGYQKSDFDLLLIRSRGGLLITPDEAYEEWLEYEGNPNLVGFKFGIDSIDSLIEPGMLPGQVFVMLARTGVGKTLVMLNLFYKALVADPTKKILFLSLEQTRNEWFERARRIYQFHNMDEGDSEALAFYRNKFMLIDKNRITEEEMVGSIEQFEYEMGQKPDLVAVDYLGYWARSYKGESYERTSAAIMALKAIAKEMKIPIIAPHQVSRGNSLGEEVSMASSRDSGVVEETADFISGMWSADQRLGVGADQRTDIVKIKMLKSRHGNVGREIDLQFAPHSLVMIPKGDPLFNRAADEHKMALSGVSSFEEAMRNHRSGNRNVIYNARGR